MVDQASKHLPKLLLALVSGGVAALLLWRFLPDGDDDTVAFHQPDIPTEFEAPEAALSAAEALSNLPGPFEASEPVFPASGFRRTPLDERTARRFFEINDTHAQYDPWCYYRHTSLLNLKRPWEEHPKGMFLLRTNSLGLRMDAEPSLERPDLRILVAGDSHTDGVCFNKESFPARLEALLAERRPGERIEALNAGKGGYSFYNYLGVLERLQVLAPDVFVVAVYGGNDFLEGLSLYHYFQRSSQPNGMDRYGPLVKRAMEIHGPSLAQGFGGYRYFATYPDQMEVALQMARDVTTEIQVTCLRNGVHPIFVYLPSPMSAQWDHHAGELQEVLDALELTRADLERIDGMGQSYLDFLRERRLDVLDLRATFSSSAEGLYWKRDHHINLLAHERIAEGLLPLVEAARPAGAERIRQGPVARVRPDRQAALARSSPGAHGAPPPVDPGQEVAEAPDPGSGADRGASGGPSLEDEGREEPRTTFTNHGGQAVHLPPVAYRPLEEAEVEALYGPVPHQTYDADMHLRRASDLDLELEGGAGRITTNGHGLRGTGPLRDDRPDLRILLAGDEQAGNEVDDARTMAGLLRAALLGQRADLDLEVIDATVPGHSFYNYRGVLERLGGLRPDVLVMVVNGGNDFHGLLEVHHFLRRSRYRGGRESEALAAALEADPGGLEQIFRQLTYFQEHQRQMSLALRAAQAITLEMQAICDELGIQFLVVYVPNALQAHWTALRPEVESLRRLLDVENTMFRHGNEMGSSYVRDLRAAGIRLFDLRLALRDEEGLRYDVATRELDERGRQLAVDLLLPLMERWFAPQEE